jgi:uncharacterized protein YdhG (YjbR/CyaY superfamily)
MQSKAKDVTAYIQEATGARQEYLTKLRELCLEVLTDYEEVMEYGMPGYKKNGTGEVGFANQKNYISLYILKVDVVQANRALLKGLSVGKGCIRFSNLKKMDMGVIRKLLEDTVKSKSTPC